MRYRLYAHWGLSPPEIAKVVADVVVFKGAVWASWAGTGMVAEWVQGTPTLLGLLREIHAHLAG